jgi:hypothetical protein
MSGSKYDADPDLIERVRKERAAQGLPLHAENPDAIARLVAVHRSHLATKAQTTKVPA